jgi:hypothetical protein
MYNKQKIKIAWIIVSGIAIIAMIFFTIMPAFY